MQQELKIDVFTKTGAPDLYWRLGRFRKDYFVNKLGWVLKERFGLEEDEFDTSDAVYCMIRLDGEAVGGWRAIPCDRPTLTVKLQPHLGELVPELRSADYTEITRFGALPSRYRNVTAGQIAYAMMMDYGYATQSHGLIALVDLVHERHLKRMGFGVSRFAEPFVVPNGENQSLTVVAGQIPLHSQTADMRRWIAQTVNALEINDETHVFRPARISA